MNKKIHPVYNIAPGFKRGLLSPLALPPGKNDEQINFDHQTLIYDIWLSSDRSRVEMLCPPPNGLRDQLFPVRGSFNGQDLRFRAKHLRGTDLIHFSASVSPQPSEGTLRLSLGKGARELSLGLAPTYSVPADTLFLVTIQKDNQVEWIRDWAKHYRGLGIGNVFLYDNGSRDPEKLKADLEGVEVVDWPFPFGPAAAGVRRNLFTHVAALNHARLRFGSQAVLVNFDIDELLVLPEKLEPRQIMRSGVRYYDSFWVPNIPLEAGVPQFYYFTRREAHPRRMAFKFVAYSPKVHAVTNHLTVSKFNLFPRLLQLARKLFGLPIARAVPLEEGYFLHFKAITTNWKIAYWDRSKKEDLSRSVEDAFLLKQRESRANQR